MPVLPERRSRQAANDEDQDAGPTVSNKRSYDELTTAGSVVAGFVTAGMVQMVKFNYSDNNYKNKYYL